MRTARLLAAGVFALASLPLLMAQQVDATAQQNASASAAGLHANQSTNAGASANMNHGRTDVNASSNASGSARTNRGSASASSNSYAVSSADMRPVKGELEGKLDSKTAKAGDTVVLKTSEKIKTASGLVIPKGSRLIGHVTEVQAHSKERAESRMGLEFDRVELRGGHAMAIRSMIESVSPSPASMAAASMENEDAIDTPMGGGAVGGGMAGGGRLGGGLAGGAVGGSAMTAGQIGSGLGSTTGTAMRTTSNVGGAAAGNLGSGVRGVASESSFVGPRATGIQGVMLTGDAANSTSGTLSAANRNLHLAAGTQMVLGIAAAR